MPPYLPAVIAHVFVPEFVFTLGDLAAVMKKAFPNLPITPSVAAVNNAIDFKALLSKHLFHYSGHTGMVGKAKSGGPHAFRFKMCKGKDGDFVGMQTRTLASQIIHPWCGDDGSTDEQRVIPVFKSMPPLSGPLPLCTAPVQLPSTLEADMAALNKFFSVAASKRPGAGAAHPATAAPLSGPASDSLVSGHAAAHSTEHGERKGKGLQERAKTPYRHSRIRNDGVVRCCSPDKDASLPVGLRWRRRWAISNAALACACL